MPTHHPLHGPLVHDDGTTTFRVWAPHADDVELVLGAGGDDPIAMQRGERGWWSLRTAAVPGDRYAYALDGSAPLPDPASRRQPDGVHEASALLDTASFEWPESEDAWQPPPLAGAAIYELHVGTFTDAGTFDAAATHVAELADLGITHVEIMPVNGFNGVHGWGYDGVAWHAVHEPYGGPEAFARFVGACHAHGLAVILDVVYNHLGPSGNYLPHFGPYLTDRYGTPWGEGVNLDGPGSDEVRALIVDNALMWLGEYHVDGLRLDAVHGLIDTSATHVLAQLADAVRDLEALVGRPKQLIAESDRQDPATITPRALGGVGLDAQWLDDLHHGLHVALTGEHEGYYGDYTGLVDVAASYARGFVYDGRYSVTRQRIVGAPLGDLPSDRLVACVQNHDQVGNRAHGDRLTTLVDPSSLRVAITLLCAAPSTPMLFMGEEYGERRPFLFFSSHPEPELAAAVSEGRKREFGGFGAFAGDVPDPQDPATFMASKLDRSAAESAEGVARRAFWRDVLALRRAQPALVTGQRDLVRVVHADERCFAAWRTHPSGRDVLVAANLADEDAVVELGSATPLLRLFSSEDARYGGTDAVARADGGTLVLPARSAGLFTIAD